MARDEVPKFNPNTEKQTISFTRESFTARRGFLKQLVISGAALVLSRQVLAQGVEQKKLSGLFRENEQTAWDMESLLAEATLFIRVNSDGTLGLLPGSSPTLEVQQLIQAAMAELNTKVQLGEMSITNDLSIRAKEISRQRANESGVSYFWWGRRWALNNTDTQRLIAALAAGTALAAFFPGAGRVVAFVLGLGAAVV